jgi:hypothetical protein
LSLIGDEPNSCKLEPSEAAFDATAGDSKARIEYTGFESRVDSIELFDHLAQKPLGGVTHGVTRSPNRLKICQLEMPNVANLNTFAE